MPIDLRKTRSGQTENQYIKRNYKDHGRILYMTIIPQLTDPKKINNKGDPRKDA